MRDRIQRQIEQRTTMLAGVSHDLRTPLTRLKLQLAMLPQATEIQDLNSDIVEMEDMLDDYLDFARGYHGETASEIDFGAFVDQLCRDAERRWPDVQVRLNDTLDETLRVKHNALRRCITNLVNNACAHAKLVHVSARRDPDGTNVLITVDDNGTGIPAENREDVFRPFYRLDDARTAQMGGTGLGLAIARDIARGHGGDITLDQSNLGGLQARISIPA
jgi:two-component system osmolarity sensor histidine kinase EnvZ